MVPIIHALHNYTWFADGENVVNNMLEILVDDAVIRTRVRAFDTCPEVCHKRKVGADAVKRIDSLRGDDTKGASHVA